MNKRQRKKRAKIIAERVKLFEAFLVKVIKFTEKRIQIGALVMDKTFIGEKGPELITLIETEEGYARSIASKKTARTNKRGEYYSSIL